jgi:hypothetical protein
MLGSNTIPRSLQPDPAFAYIPDIHRGMPALSGLNTTSIFKKTLQDRTVQSTFDVKAIFKAFR